jgi:hypothetical protein
MPSRFPEPEYIHDTIDGAVFDLPDGMTLVAGAPPARFYSAAPLLSGVLVIRYAISLLVPPSQALIPGLFVSEKGVALVGREAWDFMMSSFQLYPRADVVGLRAANGTPHQVFLRELDFGAAVRVLVYDSVDVSMSPIEVTRLLIGDNAGELPELLRRYLSESPTSGA